MEKEALERENKDIVNSYRRLLRKAKPFLKANDAKQIRKAFKLAVAAHEGMRRKSGEPYIYHPLAVAEICVEEIGLGTTSIIAALLHDVVEDTDYTIEDLTYTFGKRVAKIIDGLTKISGVFEYGGSGQAENFRKMLLTLSDDVRVILIKLADRLHNMRTLDSMPKQKQLKIASETIFLYAPLAHRLGLYAIKSELEDLHLKYTETAVYEEIVEKISATKDARDRFIKKFIRPVQTALNEHGFDYSIKGRTKSVHSILSKMRKKDIPFEEVYDLFAIRIIINTSKEAEKAACWQVYSLVTDFYNPNPDRLRDWVSTPKVNGYESLHTTVMSKDGRWVEVQIRTKRMDEIAEKGFAAHWKYKDKPEQKGKGLEMWINDVRAMLENSETSAIDFVDDFRSNLYHDEVFVFTPNGDLKTLPYGATALDFAFEVHTEVGLSCLGAKVNQKLVPLNYQLQNGDQVEILTSSKQKPSEDWLRFVVSSKARSGIKHGLKDEIRQVADMGKEIVIRKLKQLKIPIDNDIYNKLTSFFGYKTTTDLLYNIGKDQIDSREFKRFKEVILQQAKAKSRPKSIQDLKHLQRQKIAKDKDDDILFIGEDLDIIDYKAATCCNPIPGDDVFGFVTVSEGIKIHRTSCPNAPELLSSHGHRVVKAKWASKHRKSFLVVLEIIGTDRVGLISDVTLVISEEHNVNMRSIVVDTDTGIFEGKISLYIDDQSKLKVLIKQIENVEGVVKVTRKKETFTHRTIEQSKK
jgi:GTP diphosphokinase / guanosine-3',5'-bis(diphosphate) 3'-diphosphatase